ncbi:MAG: hypothetical protein KAU14_09880, partial [Thermoplasmata archaeon]|nr:hypothetical protein [Thermoplasmata archaeon]
MSVSLTCNAVPGGTELYRSVFIRNVWDSAPQNETGGYPLAAKKASRATSKKLKDKWRAKQWYTITAPEIFDSREVPATPADDPSKLMGRVVEVTMQELTSDFSKS